MTGEAVQCEGVVTGEAVQCEGVVTGEAVQCEGVVTDEGVVTVSSVWCSVAMKVVMQQC